MKIIHIWIPLLKFGDRNRSENDIDSLGFRARAVAKVRDGVIEKVIVLESGNGYVDPVIYVRGSPNNKDIPNTRSDFFEIVNGVRQRQWRCTNLRESIDGSIVECGHIQMGLYPPENVLEILEVIIIVLWQDMIIPII